MDATAVCERVRQVAAVRTDTAADGVAVRAGLRSVAVVRAWLAAAEAELVRRLAQTEACPEQPIAEAGRGSVAEAA